MLNNIIDKIAEKEKIEVFTAIFNIIRSERYEIDKLLEIEKGLKEALFLCLRTIDQVYKSESTSLAKF